MLKKIEKIYLKYERRLLPLAFFLGFVWDSLTLRRIDLWFENLVFLVHLLILGTVIFILNTRRPNKYLPLVMQFSFGALFSAFFIFYSRSSSLMASWPFLVLLFGLLVGNEVFRKRYSKFIFQLSIYFIVVFSYFIFAIPILVGKMGAGVFLVSGFASLVFIALFACILSFKNWRSLSFSILAIYLFFNVLYFTNIIPPIPLSVKESGIYHSVSRLDSGEYVVGSESTPWYLFYKDFNPKFHWQEGTSVYSYSAVFAPTKIDTKIFHRWSYFDKEKNDWVETNRIGFAISGGRGGGFRGYTLKNSVTPGKWRVDVITERGQIVGRTNFEIIKVEVAPELETKIK